MATKKGVIRFAKNANKTQFAKLIGDSGRNDYVYEQWYLVDSNDAPNPIKALLKNFEGNEGCSYEVAQNLLNIGLNIVLVPDLSDISVYQDEFEPGECVVSDDELIKHCVYDSSPVFTPYVASPDVDISQYDELFYLPEAYIAQCIKEYRTEEKAFIKRYGSSGNKVKSILTQIETLQKELAKHVK